jgi:hypothetical protein
MVFRFFFGYPYHLNYTGIIIMNYQGLNTLKGLFLLPTEL